MRKAEELARSGSLSATPTYNYFGQFRASDRTVRLAAAQVTRTKQKCVHLCYGWS